MAPTNLPATAALARLVEGNRRYVQGVRSVESMLSHSRRELDVQRPFAIILGCADSRAPAEYVFDQGLGDLFVIRVAGNIVAPSLVGSVEFAASQFGTRLVVVMGHTRCGAVQATLDALLRGGKPVSPNLDSIVRRIRPHVQDLFSLKEGREPDLTTAVRANALASARELRSASPIVQNLVEGGRVVIVAAVYDLDTGVVTFLDP